MCFSAPAAEEAIEAPGDDVRQIRATLAKGKEHTHCFPSARVLCFCTDTRDPEGRREPRIGRAARGSEQHQAVADGNTEEGLQEPDRDGMQHIARGDDHRVRTSSHESTRT